jgi:antirestriction protein
MSYTLKLENGRRVHVSDLSEEEINKTENRYNSMVCHVCHKDEEHSVPKHSLGGFILGAGIGTILANSILTKQYNKQKARKTKSSGVSSKKETASSTKKRGTLASNSSKKTYLPNGLVKSIDTTSKKRITNKDIVDGVNLNDGIKVPGNNKYKKVPKNLSDKKLTDQTNYLPKRQIASVNTTYGRSFKREDILDGAYIKKGVKFAEGGKIEISPAKNSSGEIKSGNKVLAKYMVSSSGQGTVYQVRIDNKSFSFSSKDQLIIWANEYFDDKKYAEGGYIKGDDINPKDYVLIKASSDIGDITYVVKKSELQKITRFDSLEDKASAFVDVIDEQSIYYNVYFKALITDAKEVKDYVSGYNHSAFYINPLEPMEDDNLSDSAEVNYGFYITNKPVNKMKYAEGGHIKPMSNSYRIAGKYKFEAQDGYTYEIPVVNYSQRFGENKVDLWIDVYTEYSDGTIIQEKFGNFGTNIRGTKNLSEGKSVKVVSGKGDFQGKLTKIDKSDFNYKYYPTKAKMADGGMVNQDEWQSQWKQVRTGIYEHPSGYKLKLHLEKGETDPYSDEVQTEDRYIVYSPDGYDAGQHESLEEAKQTAYDIMSMDDDKYARGGFVGKGELVWRKLSSSQRMEFLNENFTPEITPRSQEILVGKSYDFLPKKVKDRLNSKYANVEEYAEGGSIKYNQYENKSLDYIEGEIAHTERSARQFRQMGDEISAEDRESHLKKLWEIYYKKRSENKYARGGGISKDDSPKIYVADLAAYNEGKLIGEWLDLTDYDDADDLMGAIQELMSKFSEEQGVEREEWAIHDYENIPSNLASEYMGRQDFEIIYDLINAADDRSIPYEVLAEAMAIKGEDDAENVADNYYGEYDSFKDFAYNLVDEAGISNINNLNFYFDYESFGSDERINMGSEEEEEMGYEDMSDEDLGYELVEQMGGLDYLSQQTIEMYFDYNKFARDLEMDYDEIRMNGNSYIFFNSYKRGGVAGKSRYNSGWSWKMDRAKQNFKETYERPMESRKKK